MDMKAENREALLVCVISEYKRTVRELADAEWNGEPTIARLRQTRDHYHNLIKSGVIYEPKF